MKTPKELSASSARPEDMQPQKPMLAPDPARNDKELSSPNTSLPRYDDQPKKPDGQKSGGDLPDYGDRESGDPRQTQIHD